MSHATPEQHAAYMKAWREKNPGYAKSRYARSQGRQNSRNPWTEAEDKRVLAKEVPDAVLAAELGRSEQAIHMRRHKITRDA